MKSILGEQHNDPKTSLDEQAEHSVRRHPQRTTAYVTTVGGKIPLNISKPYSSSSEAVTSPQCNQAYLHYLGFASPAGSSPPHQYKMPPAAEIESDRQASSTV
ncbi:hypothetical protein BSLG_002924 [Batrachochytrium salamandrivorans]|nr:hypothetical protein BSLG_002924 [Batrachochytrium salamandrivorans]